MTRCFTCYPATSLPTTKNVFNRSKKVPFKKGFRHHLFEMATLSQKSTTYISTSFISAFIHHSERVSGKKEVNKVACFFMLQFPNLFSPCQKIMFRFSPTIFHILNVSESLPDKKVNMKKWKQFDDLQFTESFGLKLGWVKLKAVFGVNKQFLSCPWEVLTWKLRY